MDLPSQSHRSAGSERLILETSSPRRYRWIVSALTILVMFHGLALGSDSIIKYAVHGIQSGAALELGPAVVSSIIANAFVDLIVQTVYAHRGEPLRLHVRRL